jgi:hypothetical protein
MLFIKSQIFCTKSVLISTNTGLVHELISTCTKYVLKLFFYSVRTKYVHVLNANTKVG